MKVLLSQSAPTPPQNHSLMRENGVRLEWRGGDVLCPYRLDDAPWTWFGPVRPDAHCHWLVNRRVLPFLTWRWGRFGGYLGFKAFGVDRGEYASWVEAEHLYEGSIAMHLSSRWSNSMP